MKPAALLAAISLLASCHSAPTKARKIMAPVAKQAAKAAAITTRQTASIVKLRESVGDATKIAEKLNKDRPDGDTAKLILSLRIATSESEILRGTNEDLRLTISGMEVAIGKAQDKVAVEIASGEGWKKWCFRWAFAFTALAVAIAALFYFRQSIPFLKLL
jgi:hypothetical protein